MKTKDYSYLIVAKSKKLLIEASTRKRLRRLARKAYQLEYKEKRIYVIVSGLTLKEAIKAYEKDLLTKTERKEKKSKPKVSTKSKATKVQKLIKTARKSMLEIEEENQRKKLSRLNKQNEKLQSIF